jgi:hypothetical protein
MKKLLLLSSLAFASVANAQLTQANNAPAAGDTYSLAVTSPSVLSPGAAGPGAVWTYTNITLGTSVGYAGTTYSAATYTPANVVVNTSSSESSYYESTSSFLKYYGGNILVSSIPATITYTTGAIEAVYPMTISTTSSSAVGGSITAMSNNGTFTGTASATADGTGTLVLPGKTYTNVIRVKLVQTYSISSMIINGTVEQENYRYFAAGTKNPILIINTSTTNLGSTSTQTTAMIDANYIPTGINNQTLKPANVFAFPNPANNNITITAAEATSVTITDITGKTIATSKINDGKIILNTENYINGVYFYTLFNNTTKLGVGKFTVSH